MNDNQPITDEDLHAFIDGELDATRALKVAAAMERDEALARRVSAFASDKARLAQAYGSLVNEPIPQAWTDMIARGPAPARLVHLTPRRALLALAASVVLMFAGWTTYRSIMPSGDAVAQALAAHGGTLAAPAAVALEDAGATLNATLGLALKTPDLSKMGYTLTAVTVYADAPGGKAVKLDYRDKDNRVFTLYLKPSPGAPRFDMIREGDTRICIWQDDVLSTIMVGEMSAGEMLRLASLAYAGLT